MKTGTLLALVLLSLISFGHLLRVVFQIELIIGNIAIPMMASIIATLVFGLAAFMLWRQNLKH